MTEPNHSRIDIDQLVQTIQQEALRRKTLHLMESSNPNTIRLRRTIDNIGLLLANAESRSQVRTQLPRKLNRFPFRLLKGVGKLLLKLLEILFRDQRVVNTSLVQAVRESVAIEHQFVEQLVELQGQLNTLDEGFYPLPEQVQATQDQFSRLESQLAQLERSLQQRFEQVDVQLQGLARIEELSQRLELAEQNQANFEQHYAWNDSYLRTDLSQQKRLLQSILEQTYGRSLAQLAADPTPVVAQQEQRLLDSMYVAFEDNFRGKPDDIIELLKVYLPYITKAKAGSAEAPILDLGSGRGEWLTLLRQSGYTARGVDRNWVNLERCRAKGFTVEEADILDYLKQQPDASLGAISAFHVVEHLSLNQLVQLLGESLRVLKPGGLLLLETPNSENLQVGANTFYLDPTHQRPLPLLLLKFVVEYLGFFQVEVLRLHPITDFDLKLAEESEMVQQVARHLYASRDYGLVGYKP